MRKAYAEASEAYLTLPKTRMISIQEASNEFKRIYLAEYGRMSDQEIDKLGDLANPDRITIDIVERELFSKYPFDWGKMNRCFRTTKRNVCYELLLETIKNSAGTIDSLRESRIEFVRLDSGPFRKDCSRTCQATNA